MVIKNCGCIHSNHSCYERLKRDLLDGVYAPGEKLSMFKIKKAINFGQSPIREALSRLLSKGIVFQEENKGFRVMFVSEADFRDLFQTIKQIETLAMRQAIELGDDEWEVNLVALFHQLQLYESNNNHHLLSKSVYSFQKALIQGSNSPHLINIHDNLFLKLELYTNLAIKIKPNIFNPCYQSKKMILDAALRRDVDEVYRLFNENTEIFAEQVIEALKEV